MKYISLSVYRKQNSFTVASELSIKLQHKLLRMRILHITCDEVLEAAQNLCHALDTMSFGRQCTV